MKTLLYAVGLTEDEDNQLSKLTDNLLDLECDVVFKRAASKNESGSPIESDEYHYYLFYFNETSIKDEDYVKEIIKLQNKNEIIIGPILIINKQVEYKVKHLLGILTYTKVFNTDDHSLLVVASDLSRLIESKKPKFDKKTEISKENKIKIEATYKSYLNDTLSELSEREKYFKSTASNWYISGISLITCSIIFTGYILFIQLDDSTFHWHNYLFHILRNLITVSLLLTGSRYCYLLGKSYMSESLKIADRKHAIRFGEVYLQIVDNNLDQSELKEIFKDWNLSNQTTHFSSLQATDIENSLIDKLMEFIKVARNEKSEASNA